MGFVNDFKQQRMYIKGVWIFINCLYIGLAIWNTVKYYNQFHIIVTPILTFGAMTILFANLCYVMLYDKVKTNEAEDFAKKLDPDNGNNNGNYSFYGPDIGKSHDLSFTTNENSTFSVMTNAKFPMRLWRLISNPFTYLFKGKVRY